VRKLSGELGDFPERVAGQRFELNGIGPCRLLGEFAAFTGEVEEVEVRHARESPREVLDCLIAGKSVVLTGPYAYVDAVYRYCQRFEAELVPAEAFRHLAHRGQRRAAVTEARRRRLHHLLVVMQGERLLGVEEPPALEGLQEWLQESTGEEVFLIPVRRLQRILTDMQRAREGIFFEALGDRITVFPHVYVPADRSVPAMLAEYGHLIEGKRVLDMGTGMGVLALLAARLGAAQVVAADVSPSAVANARVNVERLGLEERVEVREPADLFAAVEGEAFDVVVFNAPWIEGEPKSPYDAALYDPGYRILDGFLRAVGQYLAPGGAVLLQYSDISRHQGEDSMAHLEEVVAESGLEIATCRSLGRVSRVLGSRARVFLFEIRRKLDTGAAGR